MLQSRTAEYGGRDLHAEGAWPKAAMRRYGGVIFNSDGQVLLREPKDHFDGYVWTFPKGAPDMDEHPVETALRETLEETGHKPEIIGHIPKVFHGGVTGSSNCFYLMFDFDGSFDEATFNFDHSCVQAVGGDAAELT